MLSNLLSIKNALKYIIDVLFIRRIYLVIYMKSIKCFMYMKISTFEIKEYTDFLYY